MNRICVAVDKYIMVYYIFFVSLQSQIHQKDMDPRSEAIKPKHIDIEKILAEKRVKVPRFVVKMMERLLDKEVASLFVPADKSQNSIFKIRHLANREFFLNSADASREFVLKVVETICGGGLYHEEGSRKSFNI